MIADIRFTISVCGTTISLNDSSVVANVLNGLRAAKCSNKHFSRRLFPFQSNVYELAPFPQALEKLLS